MGMAWVRTIAGQGIALAGWVWCGQEELQRRIRRYRGIPTHKGHVTLDTTVLVRGTSPVWAKGDHGRKEQRAAKLMRRGQRILIVDDAEFRKLMEGRGWARVSDRVAGQPIEWIQNISEKAFKRAAAVKGSLDREHSTTGRVEQGYLRRSLFGAADEGVCCLCGRRLPIELLIAAHIKPRSACSRRERLDVKNIVFVLCLLGCDALYEHGFVSVLPNGKFCTSNGSTRSLGSILRRFNGAKCPAWAGSNADYFNWHASNRFQGR